MEIVRFPFVFDSALLDRGEEDFSYAGGLLSQVTPQGRSYDADRPALSAYHAVGLTKQFTAAAVMLLVEDGKLTAEQALVLIKELEQDSILVLTYGNLYEKVF